uniref:TPX2 domain-containing protein n=1 Tax=Caenorhabditis tropicalis TaxID=1561998 RepID=A0A1I7U1I0_9PELO
MTDSVDEETKARLEQERIDDFSMRRYIKNSQIRTTIMIEMLPMKPAKPESSKKLKPKPMPINKSASTDTKVPKIISSPCCKATNTKKIVKRPAPLMAQCLKHARHSTSEIEKKTMEMMECHLNTLI